MNKLSQILLWSKVSGLLAAAPISQRSLSQWTILNYIRNSNNCLFCNILQKILEKILHSGLAICVCTWNTGCSSLWLYLKIIVKPYYIGFKLCYLEDFDGCFNILLNLVRFRILLGKSHVVIYILSFSISIFTLHHIL